MQNGSLKFEQGDVAIADIVFSEQVGVKRRPVLVISNSRYNSGAYDLIVLKITSAEKKTGFDVLLQEKDLLEGSLKMDSFIMVDFPSKVEKAIITQKIGRITKEKLLEVKKKLKELYGI